MEQNKINAIIIAGLLVVGAGAWAGPIMTAQTANEFQTDLQTTKKLQTALADKEKINFTQFGLENVKNEVFLAVDPQFLAPPPFFAGPIIDLQAFKQQLIPPDVIGEQLTVAAGNNPNVFGAPVTLVENIACNPAPGLQDDLDGPTGTGPALIEDCEPAIIDKLFVMAPVDQPNKKYRIQLAVCLNQNMANHQNDGSPDNNPNNDTCNTPSGGDTFSDAIIVMDTIFQLFGDHTEAIILDVGAIPPGIGNTLMARAADNVGNSQTVNVWVGIKRVGGSGAFDFANPALFGGAAPTACMEFTIKNNTPGNPAIQGATINLSVPPTFNSLLTTDVNGKAKFQPIPEGFVIVDLFVAGKPPFFLDRPVFNTGNNSAGPPNNLNADPNCNETVFTLPVGI